MRIRTAMITAVALLVSVLAFITGSVAPAAASPATRIAGVTRVETAVLLARRAFPGTAGAVYLARSDDPADALAAGTLSNGPTLLVPKCGNVPRVVSDAIAALNPRQVFALGGENAICTLTLLQAANGRLVGRLAGSTRYETATKISQYQFPDGAKQVVLAQAVDSPDALLAGTMGLGPVLLVPPSGGLPNVVLAEVDRLNVSRVIAIGGQLSVPDVMLYTAARNKATARLFGDSRYATSVAVSQQQFSTITGAKTIYLVRADSYADALAAGPLTDGPILLVPGCAELPTFIRDEIRRLRPSSVIALGGPGGVCDLLLLQAGFAYP